MLEPNTKDSEQCQHGKCIHWNPCGKIVQCHQCGEIFIPIAEKEAAVKEARAEVYAECLEIMKKAGDCEYPNCRMCLDKGECSIQPGFDQIQKAADKAKGEG